MHLLIIFFVIILEFFKESTRWFTVVIVRVWGVQCSALWDRPCRALPKVCHGQECWGASAPLSVYRVKARMSHVCGTANRHSCGAYVCTCMCWVTEPAPI